MVLFFHSFVGVFFFSFVGVFAVLFLSCFGVSELFAQRKKGKKKKLHTKLLSIQVKILVVQIALSHLVY
jgi:hypothetical protein